MEEIEASLTEWKRTIIVAARADFNASTCGTRRDWEAAEAADEAQEKCREKLEKLIASRLGPRPWPKPQPAWRP